MSPLPIQIDINFVIALLGLGGTVAAVMRWIINLNKRFDRLERHDKDDYETLCVLITGVSASLDGLKQLGADGEVTDAAKKMKEFIHRR